MWNKRESRLKTEEEKNFNFLKQLKKLFWTAVSISIILQKIK